MITLAGCGGGSAAPRAPAGPEPVETTPLSARVRLVADNQYQYLYGKGIYNRSGIADRFALTAVRPAQLDMFSYTLVEDACSADPIIHLGDAGNASCEAEIEAFEESMQRCGQPWVMAPGNHDAYFLGNTDLDCDRDDWENACDGSRVLTKDRFVRWYVAHLARSMGSAVPGGAEGALASDTHPLVREARFAILDDPKERFRSFVVQRLDLSKMGATGCANGKRRVTGIVLDTSQHRKYPKLLPRHRNAGWTGAIQEDQWEVVQGWVAADPDAYVVLFSHHPIRDLDPDTRGRLESLVDEYPNVVLYVSAHTHNEHEWLHDFERPLFELNVGSVVDFPSEFRDLELSCAGEDLWATWTRNADRRAPYCPAEWMPPPVEFTAYRDLKNLNGTQMQIHLLRAQARTWLHVFALFPLADEAQMKRVHAELTAALARKPGTPGRLDAFRRAARLAECADRAEAGRAALGSARAECDRLVPPTPSPSETAEQRRIREERAKAREALKLCIAHKASTYEHCAVCSAPRMRRPVFTTHRGAALLRSTNDEAP